MATFTGTIADETITPTTVSPSVTTSGGALPSDDPDMIDGAGGDDIIDGGGGDDVIIGGDGDDNIAGGAGADTINAGIENDNVTGGGGDDLVFLEDGFDRFTWNPGDGSDMVDGGASSDDLNFNGSAIAETIGLSASVARTILTRDVGAVALDSNAFEFININAMHGADRIDVGNLQGTGLLRLTVNLGTDNSDPFAEAGDGALDQLVVARGDGDDVISVSRFSDFGPGLGTVSVNGLGHQLFVQGGEATDRIVLNGQSGNDLLEAREFDPFLFTFTPIAMQLTLDGGDGNDTLAGGSSNDMLLGGRGTDVANGSRGDDLVLLGSGNDRFTWNAGDGSDIVDGQTGIDRIDFNGAGVGETIDISANGGRVSLSRDVGAVTMDLNEVERIALTAQGGADSILVGDLTGTGTTLLDIDLSNMPGGGAGDGASDHVGLSGSEAGDSIELRFVDRSLAVTGLPFAVSIDEFEALDRISVDGLGGNDIILAGIAPSPETIFTFSGGAGDDRLRGGAGGDVLDGGDDADIVDYDLSEAAVAVDLATQSAFGGHAQGDLLSGFEGAIGSDFGDILNGAGGNNVLSGGGGGDQLFGQAGNDRLIGGRGVDRSDGGAGDDVHFVDQAADIVTERAGEGTDRVAASASYALAAAAEVEMLTTTNAAAARAIDLTGNFIANRITGNAGANRLSGEDGDDVLMGRTGDDRLIGGAGADRSDGGLGDDVHLVDNVGDVVIERAGQGSDRVLAEISYRLRANAEVETLSTDRAAGTGAIDLTGSDLANRIIGNDGANSLAGRGGADIVFGAGGDDRLNGGLGADRTDGGLGNDTHMVDDAADIVVEGTGEGTDRVLASVSYVLTGGTEIEQLATTRASGTDAIDLTGNELANRIVGNAGANVIDGGGGTDRLFGLAGDDLFRFADAGDSGIGAARDIIDDFEGGGAAGGDVIDLALIDAIDGGGDDAFTLIAGSVFTAPGQLRLVFLADSNETVILGNMDADSGAEFQIALSGQVSLSDPGDFNF